MLKSRLNRTACFVLLLLIFSAVTHAILLNQTNITFWFQSDNSWAPHFVYDIVYKHNSIFDWQFANGTIHLLDTLPFFVFSIFTDNMQVWIQCNAIFNLVLYFLLCYFLSVTLFKEAKSQLFVMFISLIPLMLLAYHKNINFTIDMLLVSGEHMTQMLVGMLCVVVTLRIILSSKNYWWHIPLFIFVMLAVTSDELFIASFVVPMCLALFILYIREPNRLPIVLITNIAIATVVARLIWDILPIDFQRVSMYAGMNIITSLKSIVILFIALYEQHAAYIIALFLFFPISGIALHHAFKNKKMGVVLSPVAKNTLLILTFVLLVWISGIGRIFINYHAQLFYNQKFISYSHSHGAALIRDSIDFYIIPLFVGMPIIILYFISIIKMGLRNYIINSLNIIILILLSAALIYFYSVQTIKNSLKNNVQIENQLMTCLKANIERYHLHTGIANYWIYRPIIILSNGAISIAPTYSGPYNEYAHYLSTWQDIDHKTIDYWVVRYSKFFNDPGDESRTQFSTNDNFELSKFDKADGQFRCEASDGHGLLVYFYRKNQLMQTILPSIKMQNRPRVLINERHQIILGSKGKA